MVEINRNSMKGLYLLILFLCLVFPISAQQTVTIEECQQWAIAQTSANVQKNLNEQILKTNLNNAASHLFPKLSINGRFSYESAEVPDIYPFDEQSLLAKMQYHIGMDLLERTTREGESVPGERADIEESSLCGLSWLC